MRKRLFLIGALGFLSVGDGLANPIAWDSAARPIRMVAEDVRVEVGDGVSRVKGDYVFRQGEDDWPEVRDTHVTIYVPVLLPRDGGDYEGMYGPPVVSAGGRRMTTFIRNDLASGNEPGPVPLPKGWRMELRGQENIKNQSSEMDLRRATIEGGE